MDLNILRAPEGMDELIKIFTPLLSGIEKKLVTRIDNLEKDMNEKLDSTHAIITNMETRLNKIDQLDQQARQNNSRFSRAC